jgi:hypothetical protein
MASSDYPKSKFKSQKMTDQRITEILKEGLDQEGLIRMKAVDMAISFFKDKQVSDIRHFQKTYEEIYKFITNLKEDETKGIH